MKIGLDSFSLLHWFFLPSTIIVDRTRDEGRQARKLKSLANYSPAKTSLSSLPFPRQCRQCMTLLTSSIQQRTHQLSSPNSFSYTKSNNAATHNSHTCIDCICISVQPNCPLTNTTYTNSYNIFAVEKCF